MKREIKFRAFVFGRMGEPFNPLDPEFMRDRGTFPDKTIFVQYIELKDKNGKEIYDGDIIHRHMNVYWKVTLKDGAWVALPEIESGLYLKYSQFNECEVVGNVYENPELLK